jgi:DNA-binding MarR family transcriptional regulator
MAERNAGPAVFRLVRFWSRRWAPDVVERLSDDAPPAWTVQNLMVIEAIDTARRLADEVIVADVARQLGVDRSVASRMITNAVDDGFVVRAASVHDARRASLTLTGEGQRFLASSHDWQRHSFDQLIAHWPAEDRARFSGYLLRLADEVLTARSPGP